MNIRFPYGKTHLTLSFPANCRLSCIEPIYRLGLPDPVNALHQALQQPIGSLPLRQRVRPGQTVGILLNDITRPTPNRLLLDAIRAELDFLSPQELILFVALGTHRPATRQELAAMLGEDVLDQHRVVQNNAFDAGMQCCLGETQRGHPIWINRQLLDCDLLILTGFIEPHFFAGFSGGGKAVMPGMSGIDTIFANHSASMIAHPQARWGITDGNPIYEEAVEVASLAGQVFLLNVTLNREKQITGIFCGDLRQAHAQGCDFARQTALVPVAEPFDIVVTTNSGDPLDLNLYQSVKGMSAAAQVVRRGGAILIAAECRDGLPEEGLFASLLARHSEPKALLEDILCSDAVCQDQWQAQILAQILVHCDVYVYSGNLTADQIRSALMKPVESLEGGLADLLERYGRDARICALPEGPQTIPYLKG